jgi:prophage regulatory protein
LPAPGLDGGLAIKLSYFLWSKFMFSGEKSDEAQKEFPMNKNGGMPCLIRLRDVQKIVALSRATIYRRIQQGVFPAQVKDGRCALWDENKVRQYVERLLQRQQPQ